jgi:CheY-like chemotaxis protein
MATEPAGSTSASGASTQVGRPGASLDVVLVDDEPAKRTGLEERLRRAGFAVRGYERAEPALAAMRTDPPDALVTDLVLPGPGGMELLRTVRRELAGVEVIVITAYGTIQSAVEAMKEGAFDYLTKPFAGEELVWPSMAGSGERSRPCASGWRRSRGSPVWSGRAGHFYRSWTSYGPWPRARRPCSWSARAARARRWSPRRFTG